MANDNRKNDGPQTQDPDPTADRPVKGKENDPFEMNDDDTQPLRVMPQVPEASPAVQPGKPKLA